MIEIDDSWYDEQDDLMMQDIYRQTISDLARIVQNITILKESDKWSSSVEYIENKIYNMLSKLDMEY